MRKFLYTGSQVITKDVGHADVVRNVKEQQRAFGLLKIKEFDEKTRRFKGIATTIAPDHMDDVVEPSGAEFKLPIPFLYQHDSKKPIGWIDKAKVGKTQIDVEGYVEIPDADAPATIVERLNTAWYELKKRMVRGLSIGFNPKEWSFIKETGGIRWLRWSWLELSMVTIAANAEASITSVKSAYAKSMAAPGRSSTQRQDLTSTARAGASNASSTKGSTMKVYTQEALAGLRKTRETNQARMAELLELKGAESRGFSDDERCEFDGIKSAIADLDDEIAVCEVHVANIKTARPVEGSTGRSAPYVFAKKLNDVEPRFKGEEGVKRFMATTLATLDARKGIYRNPSQVAEMLWGKTNPSLVAVMKANEVAGAGSGSGEALAELVSVDNRFTGDFVDFLYGETVFDKLPLMDVPANVSIKGMDGAYTGYWVGESKPIPMSQGSASAVSTTPLKVGGLTVLSNELLRDSSPAALAIVGQALREALSQVVDTKFFSADAVSAGVSPAGILNGVSAIVSNGGDAQSITTDFKALFAPFVTAKNQRGTFVWVMTPSTAIALSLMKNALGQPEYPTINGNGGTLLGYPVYVGDNIGAGDVILMKPSQIWKIGDRGVELSVSTEAMIEQSSAPTGATDTPVAATQAMTSMFQAESTAIKVVRSVNWGKKYPSAVAYVGDAAYGSEQS